MIFLLTLMVADVNFIAVDVRTRQVIERQWADAEQPAPVGSLVKPFVALAYGGEFPDFVCKGASDHCWLARGHGKIGFCQALAQSCNAYFLNLARGVDGATLAVIAAKFGIPPPAKDSPEARIGLGTDWRIAPLALVRAYSELASRAGEPRVDEVLAGLRLAAESGTAKALGRGVLAKTGTAACVAERRDAGDGFAVVLDPAEQPRVALLVRVHGAPGSAVTKSAARILRHLRAED
jgi:cell division protein FtsI/penicillin-binding protein 2